MKKGFSLVEILAVIVILGIILTIAIPAVQNSINSSKDDLYNTIVSEIESGAKQYVLKNPSVVADLTANQFIYVKIKVLKDQGILESFIRNPKTNDDFSDDASVKITKPATGNYIYEFVDLNY